MPTPLPMAKWGRNAESAEVAENRTNSLRLCVPPLCFKKPFGNPSAGILLTSKEETQSHGGHREPCL